MEKLTWLKQQAEHKYLVWKKYDLIIFLKMSARSCLLSNSFPSLVLLAKTSKGPHTLYKYWL